MNILLFTLITMVHSFSGLAWRSKQSALENNRQMYSLLNRVKMNHMNHLRQKRAAQEFTNLKSFKRGRFLNRAWKNEWLTVSFKTEHEQKVFG